jgi:hypothetical protein
MPSIWRYTQIPGGQKFLVVRRDGTIPKWPYFVLGGADPYAPAALRTYANVAETIGEPVDIEFVGSVLRLAEEFDDYRLNHKKGDPEAPPHRHDLHSVISAMQGYGAMIKVEPDK